MAKKTKAAPTEREKIIESFEDEIIGIVSKEKGITVEKLSESAFTPYFLDTGNYALNFILSHDFWKGLPGTKITSVEGENSKGKSLLIAKLLGENVSKDSSRDENGKLIPGGISWVVDSEDAANPDFFRKINSSNPEAAEYIRIIPNINTLGELGKFFHKICDVSVAKKNKKPFVVAVDSLSQMAGDDEMQQRESDKEKFSADMGRKAKDFRADMRTLNRKFAAANITPIYIVHLTANVGVMFGDKKVPSAHGNSLLYSASIRLVMVNAQDIVSSRYPMPIGVRFRIKTKKNRVVHKGKECFVELYFNSGIDQKSGLLDLLKDYWVLTKGVKKTKKGGEAKEVEAPKETMKQPLKPSEIMVWPKAPDWIDPSWRDEDGFVKFTVAERDEFLADNDEAKVLKAWNDELHDVVEMIDKEKPEEELLTSEDGFDDPELIADLNLSQQSEDE